MSKQFIINSICVTLFGAFLGYSVTHLAQSGVHPQSLDMASLAPMNKYKLSKLASQQIYQDYFDVRIKHESLAQKADDTSVVKAIITAKKDLPAGLSFRWKLGEDVSTSENLLGQLGELKQGEQHEVHLTVHGFSQQNKRYLSFIVDGQLDQHEVRKETLSSSRPEDSFEYVVQQAHAVEKAEAAAQRANGKVGAKSVRGKKFDLNNIVK